MTATATPDPDIAGVARPDLHAEGLQRDARRCSASARRRCSW